MRTRDAVDVLCGLGVRLLLLKPDTLTPAWTGWADTRPPGPERLAAGMATGQKLGVIPCTAGRVVVDVDAGNASDVWAVAGQPNVILPTPYRGQHGYYGLCDLDGRHAQRFDIGSASGDIVRGHRTFARLHGDAAPGLLAGSLQTPGQPDPPNDAILGARPASCAMPILTTPGEGGGSSAQISSRLPASEVAVGGRHAFLLRHGRAFALAAPRTDWDSYSRSVADYLSGLNRQFQEPQPPGEPRRVAKGIAKWAWQKPATGSKHDWPYQCLRALKRWKGNARWDTVLWLCERNRRIIANREAVPRTEPGKRPPARMTLAALAAKYDCSIGSVRAVLKHRERWLAPPEVIFAGHYFHAVDWVAKRREMDWARHDP